jgi:hypothetical protein
MTHLYTLLTGGRIDRGPDLPAATALVIAADTVLLVGTDAEAAAISRGDSMAIDLGGADVVGLEPLGAGGRADFDVIAAGGVARIRGGRLEEGFLPGWQDHPADGHDHAPDGKATP